MNTHAEYRRHSYRPPEQSAVPEGGASGSDELARLRDPSLQPTQPSQAQPQKRVAWVRPTELGSYLGPMVGRGIDLQTELARRARRAPTTTTRTLRQTGPERSTTTPTPSQEGLGL